MASSLLLSFLQLSTLVFLSPAQAATSSVEVGSSSASSPLDWVSLVPGDHVIRARGAQVRDFRKSRTGSSADAKRSARCKPTPSTFAGTAAGFSTLCSVHYCDPPYALNLAWGGNEGKVSWHEIETALGMLANVPVVWGNGGGNVLADGAFGQGAYDAGLLFELTGDRRALDIAVRMADNILAIRNNPVTGWIIWTGKRELIWPTSPPPTDGKTLLGGGSEQGDIVGHLVNPALYILKSPCLWSMVPPPHTGPTAFRPTDTYLTRALAFVKAGDETVEQYFIPHFFDNNGLLTQPNDSRYGLTADGGTGPGKPMAWNRRMLMMHGLLRLAAAHETPIVADAARTAKYDDLVRRNMVDFYNALNSTQSTGGKPTYTWGYVAGAENGDVHTPWHVEQARGVHGYYDIVGTWMAWQRNPTLFGTSDTIMQTFANSMQYTIKQNHGFSGFVNGTSNAFGRGVNFLWGGWSFYGLWTPQWYETLATANVAAGFSGRSWLAIPLLWTKNSRAVNSTALWRGQFATGYGTIAGTSH